MFVATKLIQTGSCWTTWYGFIKAVSCSSLRAAIGDYSLTCILQSDRSDTMQLTQSGTGGLTELRDLLDDSKASFAYVRVKYANDKESQREKFILVVWIGSHCKVMRKAKV
jgi:hypothetical protein